MQQSNDLTHGPRARARAASRQRWTRLAALASCVVAASCGGGGDDAVGGPADSAPTSDAADAVDTAAVDTHPTETNPADSAAPDTGPTDTWRGRNPPCDSPVDCGDPPGPCLAFACHSELGCVPVQRPEAAPCVAADLCAIAATCQAGACVTSQAKDCDDSNPCTIDTCSGGTCASLPAPATPATACDDGDACTANDACAGGGCVGPVSVCLCTSDADCKAQDKDLCSGKHYCALLADGARACKLNPATVVACDASADTPCQKNACDPAVGKCALVLTPANAPCSDGDACTEGETCQGGACKGGVAVCCQADIDCAKNEDGDACNGTLFCNKGIGKCQLNPATVVSCPSVNDTTCSKNTCDPATGACKPKATTDGEVCDDGNPCTPGESCQGGACTATKTNTCPCKNDAECANKDDGDLCNGTSYCDLKTGSCAINPATVITCPSVDDTACSKNLCQPKTGTCAKTAVVDGATCDADGNPCTPADSCQAGACVADATNSCVCADNAACAAHDDGDVCNGSLFCDKSGTEGKGVCKLNPATIVSCPSVDNTSCQQSICQAKTGKCAMTFVHQDEPCDDGVPCTIGELCKNGVCGGGGDVCLCHKKEDCLPQEDGNACNGTLYCHAEAVPWSCKVAPSTVISCPTVNDTYCQQSQCQPLTGLCKIVMLHTDEACDDDNPCTVNTVCKGGQCADPLADQGGKCNDGNPCSDDTCDKVLGCQYKFNSAPCEDGDKCTGGDVCAKGACGAGKPIGCDDNKPCTTDLCDPKAGCVNFANADNCSDGDACTVGDVCKGGACAPGGPKACSDGNPCTLDTCDSKTGACKNDASANAALVCDDGVACTIEGCQPLTGCSHTPADSICDDKQACTTDACDVKQGCQHFASDAACDDKQPCTLDTCVVGSGCSHLAQADGSACVDADPCTVGDSCKGGACKAGVPAAGCNIDPAQCKGKADGTACNDGDACTKGETCTGQVCIAAVIAYEVETLIEYQGDAIWDGPRLGARTRRTAGVARLADGSVAFSSGEAGSLRALGLDDQVRTIAGKHWMYSGEPMVEGKGTAAQFGAVYGLATAKDGAVWMGEVTHGLVLRVTADGQVQRVAGAQPGYAVGVGSKALFKTPMGLAPMADGAMMVADRDNQLLRRVEADGTVTDLAGKPGAAGAVDGKGGAARFYHPEGLAAAPDGSFVLGERLSHLVRRVQADGTVTTIAGAANQAGSVDGKGSAARFHQPTGVAVDRDGTIYVIDHNTARIRRVTADGTVTTVVGAAGVGAADGPAASAQLNYPYQATFDAFGNLVFSDWGSHRLRRLVLRRHSCDDGKPCTLDGCDAATGKCQTKPKTCDDGNPCTKDSCDPMQGACTSKVEIDAAPCDDGDVCSLPQACVGGLCEVNGQAPALSAGVGHVDGPLASVRLSNPYGLRRAKDGRVLIVETGNAALRVMDTLGVVRTIAGGIGLSGFQDGPSTSARLSVPTGGDFLPDGGIVFADAYNRRVRTVSAAGMVATIAGNGVYGFADGLAATAEFRDIGDVALDSAGLPLAADNANHRLRRVADGKVTTVAGSSQGMRDGPAEQALFSYPNALALGPDGSMFIADTGNHAVRRLGSDGVVTTIVGMARNANVEGVGLAAAIREPRGVAVTATGELWVSSWQGHVAHVDGQRRLRFVVGGGASPLSELVKIAALPDGGALVVDHAADVIRKIPAPILTCDDANACTIDTCQPGVGCKHLPAGLPCDDGNPCTAGDACAAGACKGGAAMSGCKCKATADFGCDDQQPCTVESCDPLKGCAHQPKPDGTACDDGNACTADDACAAGLCEAPREQVVATPAGGRENDDIVYGLAGFRDGAVAQWAGAASAGLHYPTDLAIDAQGRVLITDRNHHAVRRWQPDGRIDTVAGATNGAAGTGEGPALTTPLYEPEGVAVGKFGEIFVAQRLGHVISVIKDGKSLILAGKGQTKGFADGKGEAARFDQPHGLGVDASGAVLVADAVNLRVRKVGVDGATTTIAGDGGWGHVDGPAASARFNRPIDVAVDAAGAIYIAEDTNRALRRLGPDQVVTTLLVYGSGTGPIVGFGLRGVQIGALSHVAVDDGKILFADHGLGLIRAYDPVTTRVTLLAGGGKALAGPGPSLAWPSARGIVPIGAGSWLTSSHGLDRLRRLDRIGASCNDGNPCTTDACDPTKGCSHAPADPKVACPDGAPCQVPSCDLALGRCTYVAAADGLACGPSGSCVHQCLRGFCSEVGLVIQGAGSGAYGTVDGPAATAQFRRPVDAVGDGKGGIFVSEHDAGRIRRVDAQGTVSTFAGSTPGYAEGAGAAAKFNGPVGLAMDGPTLYVADFLNHRVRRVDPLGNVITIAGSTPGHLDGLGLSAKLNGPHDVAAAGGVVWILEHYNHTLRQVEGGKVSTVAGVPGANGTVDGPLGVGKLWSPLGLYRDAKGVLWIADTYNNAIRRLGPDGILTTAAGDRRAYDNADGVGVRAGGIQLPRSLVVLADGAVLASSHEAYGLRRVWPGVRAETLAFRADKVVSDGLGAAAGVPVNVGLGLDELGRIWIADWHANRVRRLRLDLKSCGDLLGSSAATAAPSCAAYQATSKVGPLAAVWVDPDGPGGEAPVARACDVTTDGGGWTSVDADMSAKQIEALLAKGKRQVLYKCSADASEGIVSPVFAGPWSWSERTLVGGTWKVGAKDVLCGDAKPPLALACGWGIGCASVDGKTVLLPGQTAANQCAGTTAVWTEGVMSLCGKTNFAGWAVYLR